MSFEQIVPVPDADSKPFWEGCRQHKLMFQKCQECGQVRWPPSFLCPECHSQKTQWIEASGQGLVYSYAVYHQAFHPAFKENLPYVVAVVRLAEGPMLMTNLVGCDHGALACDLPVEVTWDDISDEFSLPKFQLVGAQTG